MGRGVACYRHDRQHERRTNAAEALRWLRSAGRGDLSPFTPDWCAHILDMDARKLVRNGVARLGFRGLKDWRLWRAGRQQGRIKVRPLRHVTCAFCGTVFETRTGQQFCNQECAGKGQSARYLGKSRTAQPPQEEGTAGSVGKDRYALYCLFCDRVGVSPASECWWRVLTG